MKLNDMIICINLIHVTLLGTAFMIKHINIMWKESNNKRKHYKSVKLAKE